MKKILLLACVVLPLLVAGQSPQTEKPAAMTIGFEQDFLPYLTGGYFGALFIGKGHWRIRGLAAQATKPDFLLPDGFTGNTIKAYAIVGDLFLKPSFSGWWISGGAVVWNGTIKIEGAPQSGHYQQYLVNGSAGYNWKFAGNFYLSPWAGLHLRLAGDTEVPVAAKTFKPPVLNPEASVKVGWYFRGNRE